MKDFDKFKEDLAADQFILQHRQGALELLEYAYVRLRELGFSPEAGAENVLDREQFVLRVDLAAVSVVSASEVAEKFDPDLLADKGTSEAIVVNEIAACDDAATSDEVWPTTKPKPKAPKKSAPKASGRPAPPAPKSKAAEKSGVWSDAEEQTLIDLVLVGAKPREISEKLGRDVKAIQNKRARIKNKIKSARAAAKRKNTAPVIDWVEHVHQTVTKCSLTRLKIIKFFECLEKGAGIAGAGAVVGLNKSKSHELANVFALEDVGKSVGELLQELQSNPF